MPARHAECSLHAGQAAAVAAYLVGAQHRQQVAASMMDQPGGGSIQGPARAGALLWEAEVCRVQQLQRPLLRQGQQHLPACTSHQHARWEPIGSEQA